MANLKESLYVGDEIDLKEIFKILLESKKLIISIILIFTIASFIYSLSLKPSYITSAKLEIGYVEKDNGDRKLIESTSNLISDIKILIMKNPDNINKQNLSMNSIEKNIIRLETSSSSAEQNKKFLTEIINYIGERHSKFLELVNDQQKGEISKKIDLIESEISFYKSQNLVDLARIESEISLFKEGLKIYLEAKILKLQDELPLIDQEINQLNQVMILDTNNLNLLKGTAFELERLANSPTLEQIISSYKSKINSLKRERNNSIADLDSLSQTLNSLQKNTFQSDSLFKLETKRKALENYASQSDQFFRLDQTLTNTRNKLQVLENQTRIKTQPIGNIETNTVEPNTKFIISLGIIFGFIMSIFLVIIINFLKSYKESQA